MKKLLLLLSLFTSFTLLGQENSNEDEVAFAVIENVPVYDGCEKYTENIALKKCMNKGISSHVAKNFNINIAKSLNLPPGVVKISVFFKIDKKGNIVQVKAKAPHKKLEREVIRVVKSIPKIRKPGYQKGKPVIVPYYLPIKFAIADDNKPLTKKELRKLKREAKKILKELE